LKRGSLRNPAAAEQPLHQVISAYPKLPGGGKAAGILDDWLAAKAPDLQALAAQLSVRSLLLGIVAHSPYLWTLAKADPQRLLRLLQQSPAHSLELCLDHVRAVSAAVESDAQLMRILRIAKQEVALLVALADLGGVWSLDDVTRALSRAADLFVSLALRFVLKHNAEAGKLTEIDLADPENRCGLVFLAVGKLGANELNYSSDIDLMVLFDPQAATLPEGAEPGPLFVRLTKAIIRLLQERTADGYVARVDLRLRPDPGSTAIAISLPAALVYYELYGQNWERAALIKARPVAGDMALGQRFLAGLPPFIWRKYFDFAAIADIQAMKRQTYALRGHGEIAVEGHDIKRGRGGIRDIEFFVQTQQLIFGGKRPALRGARTLDMLAELARESWITEAAEREMREAYLFLRTIEHRLQMLNDEQTHRLPRDKEASNRFARFCGTRPDLFRRKMTHHLSRVVYHYALLFEHAPDLATDLGSLVFTGVVDDPETLETLAKLGFKNPALAVETVRGWHFGRKAAVQTARAREVLTELVPDLLTTFAGSGAPDAALAAFDKTLSNMPAAIELFLILKANPSLRTLFSDILGAAPRLGHIIEQRPHVLDAVLDSNQIRAALDEAAFEQRAAFAFAKPKTMEEFLDAARDFAQEESFLISLRLLLDVIDAATAARAFSALAACVVRASLQRIERQLGADHGQVVGGRCVVVALGRLGSREMTAVSDLDLMLLYEFDEANPLSGGPRALHATQYYTRLVQRLVSALTVPTRRGHLYEVDMRLRPSGRKGPVAVQMSGFLAYQTQEAETWEHMALTRARVIAGDADLSARVESTIRRIIARPPGANLRREVSAMRALIAKERVESGPWNLKLTAGGFIDIEFVAQYLLLKHAHEQPNFYAVSTAALIEQAAVFGFLSANDARDLLDAHRLYTNVTQIQRITMGNETAVSSAAPMVKSRLAAAAQVPDFQCLAGELEQMRSNVRRIFTRLLVTE